MNRRGFISALLAVPVVVWAWAKWKAEPESYGVVELDAIKISALIAASHELLRESERTTREQLALYLERYGVADHW